MAVCASVYHESKVECQRIQWTSCTKWQQIQNEINDNLLAFAMKLNEKTLKIKSRGYELDTHSDEAQSQCQVVWFHYRTLKLSQKAELHNGQWVNYTLQAFKSE